MPIKFDSYILTDHIVEIMREMIIETRIDKLERQFDFCHQSDATLLEMNRCTGNICSVGSRKVCEKGKFVGTYHTHPFPFSEKPSSGDLLNILREGFGCIGSVKTKKIKCYKYKDYPKDGEKHSDIIYKYYNKAYEDLKNLDELERSIATPNVIKKPKIWPKIAEQLDSLKEKDRLIQKYFKTIKIS